MLMPKGLPLQPGRLFLIMGAGASGRTTLLEGARDTLAHEPGWIFTEAVPPDAASILSGGHSLVAEARQAGLPALLAAWPDACVIQITTAPARKLARQTATSAGSHDGKPALPRGTDTVIIDNNGTVAEGVARLVEALRAGRRPRLAVRAVPIATWHENVAYLNPGCTAVPAAQFLGPGLVEIHGGGRAIRARVHVIDRDDLVGPEQLGLSYHAFRTLGLPEGAAVAIARVQDPASLPALRAKLRGEALDEDGFDDVIRDIADGRYHEREAAAFLVAASASLTDDEVEALARARARTTPRMVWNEAIVADKHAMGGVAGSRISLIIVPIVAAAGIAIPKTSSRAITSASGTADAMEVLARVDLSQGELRQVVAEARGALAWNGRLNHSPVDDVMNAITRPLGIDSQRWAVASILSKKLAAGATHVVIDISFGPQAKTPTREAAEALGDLFTRIGARLGLHVEAVATDGSAPIGRGIGPALEARDALAVLNGDPDAPVDLRAKALMFAGIILGWVGADGPSRAAALLDSGAARAAMDRIIRAQGAQERVPPARLLADIHATTSGRLTAIDGARMGEIARRAGAPAEKAAGVDLLVAVGSNIQTGDTLFRIHANDEGDLGAAMAMAAQATGCTIDRLNPA
jgi:thymidine phosphorylase